MRLLSDRWMCGHACSHALDRSIAGTGAYARSLPYCAGDTGVNNVNTETNLQLGRVKGCAGSLWVAAVAAAGAWGTGAEAQAGVGHARQHVAGRQACRDRQTDRHAAQEGSSTNRCVSKA